MENLSTSGEIERITHEPEYEEAWVCLCGNTPIDSGFFPCNEQGAEIEPTEEDGWDNLQVCARCGRIIDQDTLQVWGYAR